MKYYQIFFLIIILASCKTNYEGIKRIEIHANYIDSEGKPGKRVRWKEKIEHRIYDKNLKLLELVRYGGEGNWHSIVILNKKDYTITRIDGSLRNFKERDYIEEFEYDVNGNLIKRSLWLYKDNRIDYLALRNIFDTKEGYIRIEKLDYYGDIQSVEKVPLMDPIEITEDVFIPNTENIIFNLSDANNNELLFDKDGRLEKILYLDKDNNLLGYRGFTYEKLKKIAR